MLKQEGLKLQSGVVITGILTLVLLSIPRVVNADDVLVVNGSFELGKNTEPPTDIKHLKPGSSALKGWEIINEDPRREARTVTGSTGEARDESEIATDVAPYSLGVDWIGPARWKAAQGDYCLDLDGGIRQKIRTTVGEVYEIQFDFASNPELGQSGPTKQALQVMVDQRVHEFKFDSTGKNTAQLGWAPRRIVFTANASATAIIFYNPKPNSHSAGVALDNVSVRRLCLAPAKIPSAASSRVEIRWGKKVEGLVMGLQIDEAKIPLGEKIKLTILIKNVAEKKKSTQTHTVENSSSYPFTSFIVCTPNGRKVTLHKLSLAADELIFPPKIFLKPREIYLHAVTLNEWSPEFGKQPQKTFASPGTYTIQCAYSPFSISSTRSYEFGSPNQSIQLESATIKIQIKNQKHNLGSVIIKPSL